MRVTAVLCVSLLAAPVAGQERLESRPSFQEFPGVGDVRVVSGVDQVDPESVRLALFERLAAHELTAEWSGRADAVLVVDVKATHDTPRRGDITHHSYFITVYVEEPVAPTRAPYSTFMGLTWRTETRVATFGAEADTEVLVSSINNQVMRFVHAVLRDRSERG